MNAPFPREQVRKTATEAAYQVESIASVLLRIAPEAPNGGLLDESLVRLFALRLQALSGVLMEVVNWDQVPAGDDLKRVTIEVFGELPADDGRVE